MFKSFSEKSKAKRGLLAVAKKLGIELSDDKVNAMLHMDGNPMKWGFEEDRVQAEAEAPVVRESSESGFAAAGIGTELQPLQPAGASESEDDASDEPEASVASGNMFANIGATLVAVASTPAASATRAPAASRTAYTIEKDRPEQNGIKRPSAGGLCRAVWDAMDEQRATNGGETPTTQQVRDLALMHNWNVNNAMIEYYQWRKFNGITGRAKKVEVEPATV